MFNKGGSDSTASGRSWAKWAMTRITTSACWTTEEIDPQVYLLRLCVFFFRFRFLKWSPRVAGSGWATVGYPWRRRSRRCPDLFGEELRTVPKWKRGR